VLEETLLIARLVAAESKLELAAGSPRQIQILLELVVLAPAVRLTAERDLPP
jgi:hypothetical protein